MNEFFQNLKDFKKLNINNLRKYDNMTSLTLKSEYSEEFSDVMSNFEDFPNFNLSLCAGGNKNEKPEKIIPESATNVQNINSMNINNTNNFKSLKNTDSIDNILHGLTRIKTEDDKIKIKNLKKVKNKKLGYSNTNSDIESNDGKGKKQSSMNLTDKFKTNIKEKEISELKSSKQFKTKTFSNLSSTEKKLKTQNALFSPRQGSNLFNTNNSTTTTSNFYSFKKEHKSSAVLNNHLSNNIIEKIIPSKAKGKVSIVNTVSNVTSNTNKTLEQSNSKSPKIKRKYSEEASLNTVYDKRVNINVNVNVNYTEHKNEYSNIVTGIEGSNSVLIKNYNPSSSSIYLLIKYLVDNIIMQANIEQLESVSDEWIIAPLNKIPVRTSKLISEKPIRVKAAKSMPDYLNLK